MKISEYNQMISHLTRPDTRSPEVQKAEEQKRTTAEANRINAKRKEYGLSPIEQQVKNYSPKKYPVQQTLPGMSSSEIEAKVNYYGDGPLEKLKKFGIEESSVKQPGYPKRPDPMEVRGQQTLALNNVGNKILNEQIKRGNIKKEDLILKEDKNGLMVNKNRTVALRDSFMAKQFNRALGVNDEPMATPEQVGKLAERLERNAQMTGKDGPFSKVAKKPIIKKPFKKISKPLEPMKIDPTPLPPSFYKPEPVDPRHAIMEARFKELVRKNEESKHKNEHGGLAGLLKPEKKFI